MSKKHIHKYHKVETDAGALWACALPDCNHFMPSHYAKLLPGKGSICWSCDDLFVLDGQNMLESKPRCNECRLGDLSKVIDEKLAGI